MKKVYSIVILFVVFSSCKKEVAPITSLPAYESFSQLDLVWRKKYFEERPYTANLESYNGNLFLFESGTSLLRKFTRINVLNGERVFSWDNFFNSKESFKNYSVLNNVIFVESFINYYLIDANLGVSKSNQNKGNIIYEISLCNDKENKFYIAKEAYGENKINILETNINTINWKNSLDILDSNDRFGSGFSIEFTKNNNIDPILIFSTDCGVEGSPFSSNKIIAFNLNKKEVIWEKIFFENSFSFLPKEIKIFNNKVLVFLNSNERDKNGISLFNLHCNDLQTGKTLWKKNFQNYGNTILSVNKNILVSNNTFMTLYDSETGAVKWTIEPNFRDVFFSNNIFIFNNFILIVNSTNIIAIDANSGKIVLNKVIALPNTTIIGKPALDEINKQIYILDSDYFISCFKIPAQLN